MARVLLIGTDDTAQPLLKNILECAGHTVIMAGNFGEGCQYVGQWGADVVLTDFHNAASGVFQAIAHLRVGFPQVKILVLATKGDVMDFLAVRAIGADDVLTQPLASNALLEAVDQALRGEDGT